MLFDCSDIDLLRLTGFLKNLPTGQEQRYSLRLLTPSVLGPLQEYGYLGLTRNGLSYSLKSAGYDFLRSLGFDYPRTNASPPICRSCTAVLKEPPFSSPSTGPGWRSFPHSFPACGNLCPMSTAA